jgi:PAS domain S-box-containing protein
MSESRPTVLVVDDSPGDCFIYRRYLHNTYNVHETASVREALALCDTLHPACLLVDYQLPDGDGLDVLHHVQAQQGTLAPPVILLTGVGSEVLAVEAMKQGVQDYLVKGQFTREGLLRVVYQALETVALHRRLAAHHQQVRESDARLQLALEAARLGTWDLDVHSQSVTWSEILQRDIGLSPGTYEAFLALVHVEDRARVMDAVTAALVHGSNYELEYRLIAPTGQVRWRWSKGQVVRDAAGQAVRLTGISMDITTRKQAEATREQLAAIVDASEDAILSETLEGRITSWNRAATRMYGYTAEEVLGQSIALLIPPDRANEMPQILERLRRGERIEQYETQHLCKDGTRLDVSLAIAPICDSAGQIIGVSSTARDLTAHKRAEAALQRAYATLEQCVEERTAALRHEMAERQRLEREAQRAEHFALLGRLAAGVSHEIRNPLAALFLHVDLLEEELQQPSPERAAQVVQALGEIRTQLTRLNDLMQDYLALVRASQIERTPQDLGAAIRAWAAEWQQLARRQGVMLRLEGPEELGTVAFHPSTLRRVLLNLIQNGLEAMPHGGTLTLAGQRTATHVQLQVRDTGSGIPTEQLTKIFEPLYTTKPGGTGLGLYIVQEIIAAHGGTHAVESALGRGTTFTMTLPTVAG